MIEHTNMVDICKIVVDLLWKSLKLLLLRYERIKLSSFANYMKSEDSDPKVLGPYLANSLNKYGILPYD
ncbi:hypothetical protein DVH24_031953 [Malus domestica]|uniref:Uncharacterized protein n=1 Tax=Malus domestica TaxID=3750 RepID=A0A498J347_MALDO|nr:hypothetical protein DVH24_031953 [Malus domestica]